MHGSKETLWEELSLTDMKHEMFLIADEIAMKEHGEDVGFYDLSEKTQMEIYGRAMAEWMDRKVDEADSMREEFELKRLEKEDNENCPVEHCWNCPEVETCRV